MPNCRTKARVMWLWSAKPADDLGGSLAGLNAPPEFQTTTIESKTNIFRACEPGVVHPTENFMSGEMARQFAYQNWNLRYFETEREAWALLAEWDAAEINRIAA
jgi:hypothetical protein